MELFNCPECDKEISDKSDSCPHCGNPIQKNNTMTNTYNFKGLDYDISDVLSEITKGNQIAAMIIFRELTKCNTSEAKTICDNLKKDPNARNYIIKCPRCGSSEFDMIKKNWSFVTGLMTNKVDRVCRNCKKKF